MHIERVKDEEGEGEGEGKEKGEMFLFTLVVYSNAICFGICCEYPSSDISTVQVINHIFHFISYSTLQQVLDYNSSVY